MITFQKGDIFQSEVEAIVNPVNCRGVMGKGLAQQFKKKWPAYYKDYVRICTGQLMFGGEIHIYENGEKPKYIISFPTKLDWYNQSKMAYITDGLIELKKAIYEKAIKSISIPALGCGCGGLNWFDVRKEILRILDGVPSDIHVFQPR